MVNKLKVKKNMHFTDEITVWANKSYVLKISVLLDRRGSKLKINK